MRGLFCFFIFYFGFKIGCGKLFFYLFLRPNEGCGGYLFIFAKIGVRGQFFYLFITNLHYFRVIKQPFTRANEGFSLLDFFLFNERGVRGEFIYFLDFK